MERRNAPGQGSLTAAPSGWLRFGLRRADLFARQGLKGCQIFLAEIGAEGQVDQVRHRELALYRPERRFPVGLLDEIGRLVGLQDRAKVRATIWAPAPASRRPSPSTSASRRQ